MPFLGPIGTVIKEARAAFREEMAAAKAAGKIAADEAKTAAAEGAVKYGEKIADTIDSIAASPRAQAAASTARTVESRARNHSRALTTIGMIGAFSYGLSSRDPIEYGVRRAEEAVTGDPNYSRRILGRPLSASTLTGALIPKGPFTGITRTAERLDYVFNNIGHDEGGLNTALISQSLAFERMRVSPRYGSTSTAPGSMVFGMFNTRFG